MLHTFSQILVTAFAFLAVLSVVVFVHEFGHFQVARWCRVAIDTFSIGFGRTLFGWRDRHGVHWKVGALPLGGYVKFQDDSDPTSTLAPELPRDPAALAEARARGMFHAQPPAVRALVAVAGPASNFVFAIVVFALVAMIFGQDMTDHARLPARVDEIVANSPAANAGFKLNDVIVAVDHAPIKVFGDLQKAVAPRAGVPLVFTVRRDGALVDLKATPASAEETSDTGVVTKTGRLGIGTMARPSETRIVHPNPVAAIGIGVDKTVRFIESTGAYVGNVITGKASPNQIAGPLGIAQMSGQVASSAVREGPWYERVENLCASLVMLAGILSVAVGIMNLLPVPVLDGGLILFCAIEAVRGRPLDPKAQELGFRAGLAVIASLFLFATWNDLQRLNVLEFLRGMLS